MDDMDMDMDKDVDIDIDLVQGTTTPHNDQSVGSPSSTESPKEPLGVPLSLD